MPEFDDDNKTIFSTDLDSDEREAVRSGEKRGKRIYEKEHPRCGLMVSTPQYRKNYKRIFGHD